MKNKEPSNHPTERCYLCLLESNEEVQLEKVDLKHLKQKHPYIKTIKAYRELCQHLKKIHSNYDKEKKSILDFLTPFSRYLGNTLTSIFASLIAAYLFKKFQGDKNQYEKEIDILLKNLNEYQELNPTDNKSRTFIKIFNFFKNIINKNTSEALDFINEAKVIDVSIMEGMEGGFPLFMETKIEKMDVFSSVYDYITPFRVSFFCSRVHPEGEIAGYKNCQLITASFDYESDPIPRKSKAYNKFSDHYNIYFSSKGIERIDYMLFEDLFHAVFTFDT